MKTKPKSKEWVEREGPLMDRDSSQKNAKRYIARLRTRYTRGRGPRPEDDPMYKFII